MVASAQGMRAVHRQAPRLLRPLHRHVTFLLCDLPPRHMRFLHRRCHTSLLPPQLQSRSPTRNARPAACAKADKSSGRCYSPTKPPQSTTLCTTLNVCNSYACVTTTSN
eukprot:4618833-Pyramimonas_sp.AAC.1